MKNLPSIPPKGSVKILQAIKEILPTITNFNINERLKRMKIIQEFFKKLENTLSITSYCISGKVNLLEYIDLIKLLGQGSFGTVYKTCFKNKNDCFAIKETQFNLREKKSNLLWETNLSNSINKLVIDKICPNLPLLIDTRFCDQCKLKIGYPLKEIKTPCFLHITELADGTLKDFFELYEPSEELQYNLIFQIMSGVHSLQNYLQIVNNDIKSMNILYHKIKKGGYWNYNIDGIDYFVPNLGFLFIVNDFGVSSIFNPFYKYHKDKIVYLGRRDAFVKNDEFVPFTTEICPVVQKNNKIIFSNSKKILWSNDQKSTINRFFLINNKLIDDKPSISLNLDMFLSEKFPPYEFYNDIQDVIRMFLGGKRSVQPSNHVGLNISINISNKLKKYLGKYNNAYPVANRTRNIETYCVLAGSFIKNFFGTMYSNSQQNIIEKYIL